MTNGEPSDNWLTSPQGTVAVEFDDAVAWLYFSCHLRRNAMTRRSTWRWHRPSISSRAMYGRTSWSLPVEATPDSLPEADDCDGGGSRGQGDRT